MHHNYVTTLGLCSYAETKIYVTYNGVFKQSVCIETMFYYN